MRLIRQILDLFYDEHGITPSFVLGVLAVVAGVALAWGLAR